MLHGCRAADIDLVHGSSRRTYSVHVVHMSFLRTGAYGQACPDPYGMPPTADLSDLVQQPQR